VCNKSEGSVRGNCTQMSTLLLNHVEPTSVNGISSSYQHYLSSLSTPPSFNLGEGCFGGLGVEGKDHRTRVVPPWPRGDDDYNMSEADSCNDVSSAAVVHAAARFMHGYHRNRQHHLDHHHHYQQQQQQQNIGQSNSTASSSGSQCHYFITQLCLFYCPKIFF